MNAVATAVDSCPADAIPFKRPYVKSQIDWCPSILAQWAEQLRRRPRERVVVTSGGMLSGAIQKGGKGTGKYTARGVETRQQGRSRAPYGGVVEGLSGVAAIADRVVLRITGVNYRCAWVLRAEYGLIPELQQETTSELKANHLGAYLDGYAWPVSAYADRLGRGHQMFSVGFLAAVDALGIDVQTLLCQSSGGMV